MLPTETRKRICLRACGKINLFLEVTGRRPDGYHNLETVFTQIDLCDDLNFTLTKSSPVELLHNLDNIPVTDNLVYKVAGYVQQEYKVPCGARIVLHKNMPLAAGLGGGSSDAAATINGLDSLWDLRLTDTEKHDIAARFGSDINFFLLGGWACGTGRGERVSPLPYHQWDNILLVNPGFAVLSGQAYSWCDLTSPRLSLDEFMANPVPAGCFNRLEAGVAQHFSKIGEIIAGLKELGAQRAMLSGSGPTVIGFFAEPDKANLAAALYKGKGMWTYVTRTTRSVA